MNEDADGASPPPSTSEPLPQLALQLLKAIWAPEGLSRDDVQLKYLSALERMKDIKPAGPIESMLAVQMVATHDGHGLSAPGDVGKPDGRRA